MRVKILIAMLIVGLVLVSGCVEEVPTKGTPTTTTTTTSPTKGITTTPTTTPKTTTTTTPSELNLKIGETAKTSELEVTVENVFKTRVIGDKYGNYWAKDGHVLILAHVIVKNVGSDSEHYVSPSDFSISDEAGRKYDQPYMRIDGRFEGARLLPGEYAEGLIAFEVPENAKAVRIKYNFGFFTVKLASWEAKMEEIPTKNPQVEILDVSVGYGYDSFTDTYEVNKVIIVVKNTGDLPIHLGEIEVKYGNESWEFLGYADQLLKPGQEVTIEESEFKLLKAKPEEVGIRVRFVDDGRVLAEASYTKTVYVEEATSSPILTLESNEPPRVRIIEPKDGEVIQTRDLPASVTIRVEASDDEFVDKIEFYVDDVLKEITYFFHSITVYLEEGAHTIRVVAYDSGGLTDEATVSIRVEKTPEQTPEDYTKTTVEPPSPSFTFEYGVKYKVKVLGVIDGDTIDVLLPDGSIERVRMLGVDTPEKSAEDNKPYEYDSITDLNYLAEWGVKAAQFTESKLEGKEVYIEFDELAGMREYYGRLLAYVYLEDGTDFTAELVKQGYARVYVEGEFKKENYYMQLEEEARREGRGLWSILTATTTSTVATATPTVSAKITYLHYDAYGNDNYNLNDEYVVIKNVGNTLVNLEGWILKDEAGHTFVFPSIILDPGDTVTIYSGSGVNTDNELYWASSRAIWNNDGDTAFLYDANGNLVDTYTW